MQKLLMASLVFLWLLIGSCFDLPRGDVVEPVCKASSQSLLQRKSQKEILFQDHWKGESLPVEPDRPTKPDDDRFEFCQASPNILGEVASETNLSDTTGSSACNDQSEVALFSPKDSSPYYEVSCCPANKQFCSGCAKLNSGKTACDVCSGGYTKRAAGCIACTDVPGWTNKAGENCYKASCSNDLFQGFSSNSACCKCGGGQAAATKFSYYVGPMALGSSAVSGHPVPRTAHLYGVDKDCELSKYGLTVDATTGELKLSSGCNAVGCGKTETIEVKCTVTAWQSNGLSASAPLTVMVSHLGYGTAVVLRSGITSLHPASGATGNFGLNCVPEASTWLSVDSSTGVLSLKGATSGGKLTEGSGSSLGRGGVCTVEQGGHQAQVTVLAPQAWTSMSYSYGSSTLLYATVGERSPVLPVKAGSGVPPTRYSAFCAGNAFAFDELSGIATFEGHVLFSLDVKTGDLQMQPEESLTKALDAIDVHAVRRKINLQCTILGHYEWLPAGQGPVLTHRLGVELRDQTCWAKKRLSFARRHHKGAKSESDCRSLCRSDATCSHFHTSGNDCYFFSGLCKDSSEHACIHKDVWVFEHFAGCGERGSCIDINLPDFHYVGGEYCPRGENVETTGQGPVYFKQGLTKQETFWLQRYDTARGDNQCASGDWAILKPDADKDYENITMGYVELHGSIVACVKSNSVDLPSDVFGNNDAQLTVKKLSVSGARATVAAPGCQTPNVTTQDKEEAAAEANEQSVYPLVFDDPATDMADDHWLHPCQCVPAKWGPWPPVAGESIADVPAGSNNEFIPPAFQIVEGEFVCEQENLIEIHVDSEDEIQDGANCRTRCQAKQCPYYWEGEVMATKQCRIYSACNELVRELGTNGALYGMSYMKSCRVADPEFCWAVTKRRSMLHAGHDGYGCLYQDLIEQCDHKLMLGGMGVSICGVCTYAAVPGRQIFASNGECMDYDPSPGAGNNVKVHPCHIDANQKWYFEGELLKTDYNDLCLDYNMGNGEVYMHPCHHGANQHWYFDGELLKNRYDNKCLDFQPDSKNIYMGNCPGSNTQHFTWSQAVHGGQQIRSDNNGKCMRVEADGNVKIGDCDVSMANRFYWDGEMIKSEKTGQCLDYHVSVGNIQMYDCHGGSNQRFYWDSKYIKSRHDNQCMDLQHGQGNVYMANCPDAPSQKWRDVDVAKPLPAGRLTDMMYGLCLDKNQENNNVYAAGCHDGNNQKWYFDGELLKNLEDGNCLDENGEGNLYVYPCHGEDNQKFYFDGHRLHNRKWGSAKCGDINGDNTKNFYMHPCHDGANQDFNWEIPRRLKSRKDPGWCLDMNPTGNNVYLHPCHRGNQQMWVFEGPILKVQYDRSRCLDMNAGSSNNLYMHSDCHHNDNQQFMWSGEQIKVKSDTNLCWEWDQGNANNLKAAPCSGSDNQKFFFDSPHYQGLEFKNAASNYCLDVDINGNGNAYMHSCHGGSNQRFIWNGEQLQSEANTNKCLDYSFGSGNVVIWDCHGGNNQKWYWDNGRLKSRHDHFCLDVLPSNNNVFVGSCSGMNTQHWQQLSSLHNSAQLTIGGGKCLRYNAQVHNNVEAAGCSETPGTMWYFNNHHRLQTEENDKCLDVHTSTGNLYMGDCHGGWNQKFYFDGHLLKTMHQDDLCLDYNVANGNVYTGSCPHHNMFNFKMQGGAMLKKMPLPKEYQHGQTLDVSCWSERFASSSSEALSCVAGVWMNSRGKKGLDGFSCAACVQVVTPRYADLDSQIRQELFFAAGMELHLTVDTRIRRSVTANGQLREGGSRDVFVAEMLPDAAETTRRYRSITNGGQCLTMSNGRLGSSACAREAEPQQMIEAMELSSLMWEEFKAGANVPAPTTSYLANRGSGPTTLRSLVLFQFGSGCGDHAMTSLGFNHGTRLGLTASCTPASTYGDHVEHRFDVPGHVQITNVGSGSCLSINQIIPWRLPDRWSGKCMDYDFQGNNVYAGSCHDGNNQLWFMADGQIISLRDLKCLDYHPGTENVYMHECHGGNNQKWYWDEDTAQLRSEYDHRCLDVNMQGSNNIYIHPCHSGNNQKFDRSERSDKAFVMGLHLQCSGFEGEDIKLEPIGGENKFHLRSGPHTLPGEFYYDKNKKRLKNLATNKCLMSHERVTVIEESCAESLEQEWDIGHGLQGLADTPIACESNQVISLFEKGHGHIRYKCVHVSGLGACSPGYSTQVDTKVHELENVKALKRMSATCPAGHGLRSIAAEASDKGAWIRLRYECCQISRIPVSVYPMRAYNPDMAHGWEGVYCPSTQDDSGRMQFSQRHSFRPHHGPSGSLTYDKFQGKWCVSGKNCAFSDIVHPLDTMMKTDEWQVVAVSDFDAVFEARGVKPLHSNKKRSPPPLIKFGASDPEYLPECKDESHPGTRTFKLELMNKEAESLDDENACKYVYGKPPKDQAGDGADGMYGWIDDLVSNLGPGQGGVTYKSVKECSDRDIIRELQLAKWSQEHFDKTKYIPLREDAISGLASMVPEVEVAPLGAGVEINDLVEMVGMLILHGAQIKRDQRLSDQEFHFEQAGHDDCNPIQHGFARTFCDLHCIRDAVRKGDDAILRALEEAVEIIGKNTQLLLEHYVGEDSKSGLLEEGQRIKKGIASRMAEMFTMAKEATLEHRASMAATRAINSFTERWRNSTHGAFAMELEELQSTVAELSKRKLSHTDEVQQYALQMANQMGTYLKAQSHVLGIYRHGAEEGKRLQQRLKRVWRSAVSTSAALLEVEEEASEEAMQEFDTMWWDMRRELDSYLGASLDYVHATTAAAQMLRDYSAHCKAGFAELKRSYSHSERAEKKAHRALKKAWTAVTSSLGEMASKVVDGAMFDHLALHDIHSLRLQKSEIKSFCSRSNETFALQLAADALQKGLFGQTQQQLAVLFGELAMLQHRFVSGGLGEAPDLNLVMDAKSRLKDAALQSTLAGGKIAKALVHHFKKSCNLPLPGKETTIPTWNPISTLFQFFKI